MKKIIIASLLLTGSVIVHGQKLTAAKVPSAVKAGLNKAHSGAVPTWEMEGANYEANFKEGGKTVSVIIDRRGTIVETETEVPLTTLPAAAQNYVKQHYAGKKIQETAKIVKASGEVNYEVMVNNRDVLFDANGKNIMKKEAKEKD